MSRARVVAALLAAAVPALLWPAVARSERVPIRFADGTAAAGPATPALRPSPPSTTTTATGRSRT
jgi:hypothetical protein